MLFASKCYPDICIISRLVAVQKLCEQWLLISLIIMCIRYSTIKLHVVLHWACFDSTVFIVGLLIHSFHSQKFFQILKWISGVRIISALNKES